MSVADLEAGKEITIPVRTGGGIFIYVTSGSLTANGAQLAEGDQARIQEESEVTLRAIGAASLVIIEVTDVAGPG
jgi:redox-sensitive bicupin YhaK (pirin superfamily)